MDRAIQDVPALWKEYDRGDGAQPPLRVAYEDKNSPYYTTFKKDATEGKFFRRRIKIINAVKSLACRLACPEVEAAVKLDDYRITMPNPSLDAFNKYLYALEQAKRDVDLNAPAPPAYPAL